MESLQLEQDEADMKEPSFLSKGIQLYLLAMVFASMMNACAKLVLQYIDEFVAVQIRMSITTIICAVHLKGALFGEAEYRKLIYLRGVLGFIVIASTFYVLENMALPDNAAIGFLGPVISLVMAALVLGEPLGLQQLAAAGMGLIGVVVIVQPRLVSGNWMTLAAAFTAVIASSAVIVLLRKLKDVPALVNVGCSALISTVLSSFAVLIRGREDWDYPQTARSWFLLLCMGVFGFCRQFCNTKAFQYEPVHVLANWKYTQLIWATLFQWIFWHTLPGLWTIVGGCVVLFSVWLSRASLPARWAKTYGRDIETGIARSVNTVRSRTLSIPTSPISPYVSDTQSESP